MIKAAIFDIDGTLLDSVDSHALAWQLAFEEHGIATAFPAVRAQIGKGGDKLLCVFLSEEQIRREGKQIQERRDEIFKRDYLPKVRPFPRLVELFEQLKKDEIRIALASSASKTDIAVYKRILGIEPYLEAESSASDVAHSKPDPDIFLTALDSLKNVRAQEALAVGDTPYDAEAAGKAGIATIGVLSGGFAAADLVKAGCIRVYRDAADLLDNYLQSPFRGSENL